VSIDFDQFMAIFGNSPWLTASVAIGFFLIFLVTFYQQAAIPLYNMFSKPVRGFSRFVQAVADTPETLAQLSSQVKELLTEIKPNGGMSIKDSLHRLEESFSVAEGQRLMLMNTMREAVFLANPDGTNKWFNTAMLTLTGREANELIGVNWVNAVYREDREYVLKEWTRAILSRSNFDLTYRMINAKNNEIFRVHTVATPIICYKGKIVGYNGVVYRYPTEVIVEAAKVTIETKT
jgi:PAS domain S-box-containing protein